jgi:uncharacterized protein YjdB
MKKSATILTIILLGVMVFTGCEIPLSPDAGSNTGLVTVSFAEGPARTVFPVKQFDHYQFFCAREPDGEEAEIAPNAGTTNDFSLAAGNWRLRVEAYASPDDTAPAAEGTAAVTVTGGQQNSVTVKLSPVVSAGTGIFKYDITFTGLTGGEQPQALELLLQKITDEEAPAPVEPVLLSANSGTLSVDSGYYRLNARFALGIDEAGITEVIHIYRNLTTEYNKAFDRADFSLVRVQAVTLGAIPDLNLSNNKTAALTAEVIPASATNRRLEWNTSDASVVTVDSEGAVTAVSAGTALITVTTVDGGKTAERAVTVLSNETGITGITVNGLGANYNNGLYIITVAYETDTGTVTVIPNHDNAAVEFLKGTDFVSDNTVNFTEGVNTISIRVTAEDGVAFALYNLVVTRDARGAVPVEGVTLVQKPAAPLNNGDTVTLTARITPADATDKALFWEVPPFMQTVSTSPDTLSVTVTAVSRGTGAIKATAANGQSDECDVEVIQQVTSIVITPAADQTVVAGKPGAAAVQLAAVVYPEDANNRNVTWDSSNPSIVSVTDGGLVSAAGNVSSVGVVTIMATAADGYGAVAQKTIVVRPMSGDTGIKTVTVNSGVITAETDGNYKHTVDNNVNNANINIVVNDACASAEYTENNPLAIGDNVIPVKITAENGSIRSYTVTVHRKKIPVTSLTLPEIEPKLKGDTFTVTAVMNEDATYQGVTWTVSGSLQTISEDGLTVTVKAISGGTGTITVTSTDDTAKTFTRDVTVYTQGDAGFAFNWDGSGDVINKIPVTVQKGETVTIAVFTLEGKIYQSYRWFINETEIEGASEASFVFDATSSSISPGQYRVGVLVDNALYGDVIVTVKQ